MRIIKTIPAGRLRPQRHTNICAYVVNLPILMKMNRTNEKQLLLVRIFHHFSEKIKCEWKIIEFFSVYFADAAVLVVFVLRLWKMNWLAKLTKKKKKMEENQFSGGFLEDVMLFSEEILLWKKFRFSYLYNILTYVDIFLHNMTWKCMKLQGLSIWFDEVEKKSIMCVRLERDSKLVS